MTKEDLPPSIKRLRSVVIYMGILLVVGTIAMFIAAFIKFSHSSHPAPASKNSFAAAVPAEKCSYKQIADIVNTGKIISSNLYGNTLIIVTSKKIKSATKLTKSMQEILVYDLCKGDVISQINLAEQ